MNIGHQEACQDSTCPSSLFLGSWRTWRFLTHLVMVSDWREHPRKASLKVSWRLDMRKPVKTPPVLQVSSWSLGGRGGSWCTWLWSQMDENILKKLPWKFHVDWTSGSLSRLHLSSKSLPGVLEIVEVSEKLGNSRNPVKAPPVLQVSSWSLGWLGGFWWTWRWCQMIRIILQKHLHDPTTKTL